MSVFEVRIEDDARVVISGELDMATSPQLTSAIESLARGTDAQQVVLDMARVSFMDSSGVAALCLAKAKLEAQDAVLVLHRASSQVESVLQMVGLDGEFSRDAPPGG